MKTVICHFYNEEFLLPWWCKHHRAIFDHGIMIDYASTDCSREIIQELCPGWQIVDSRNKHFVSADIDREVEDYERNLSGWRMALNVTEFLYGNTNRLDDTTIPTQHFVGNYVFVDMEDGTELSHDVPLWQQRYWGYRDNVNNGSHHPHGGMRRMNRSVHNYPVQYHPLGGRHYANTPESFDDLYIFYYGWVDASEAGIQRKLQIQDKMAEWEKQLPNAHSASREQLLARWRLDQQPISRDLRDHLSNIFELNRQISGQEF